MSAKKKARKKQPRKKQPKKPIDDRRANFVREYLKDSNATQAARRAGYSEKAARQQGTYLLSIPSIREKIDQARKEQAERLEIDADAVIRELVCVARADIGDIIDFTGDSFAMRRPADIPERARRAISSVKVKRYVEKNESDDPDDEEFETVEVMEFKLWPKTDALTKLGQHFALFTERKEIVGKDGAPLLPLEALRAALGDVSSG